MTERRLFALNTKKLVTASLLLALSIVINYWKLTVPIGGAPVLRISFGGPYLKYIGLLFGPLYGGIAGGLSDFIGFLITPAGGFIWPLTLIEILKGASIAWIWQKLKTINFKKFNLLYIITFVALIVFGVTNIIMLNDYPENSYSLILMNIGKKTDYVGIGLVITGLAGLFMNFSAFLWSKVTNNLDFFVDYLVLIIAIGLPSLIGTTINTIILKTYLALPDKSFIFLWTPRFIEELIMVLLNTLIICVLIKLPLNANAKFSNKSNEI